MSQKCIHQFRGAMDLHTVMGLNVVHLDHSDLSITALPVTRIQTTTKNRRFMIHKIQKSVMIKSVGQAKF
jgi:hypothetical protein